VCFSAGFGQTYDFIMLTPLLYNASVLPLWWVVGFIDAESCFHVSVAVNNTMKLGYQVSLEFCISQHIRDRALLEKFIVFFGCGYVINESPTQLQFRIRDRADLATYLFPFLDSHPLLTMKSKDYADLKRVHSMLENRVHLTQAGLDEIRAIAGAMNRGRK